MPQPMPFRWPLTRDLVLIGGGHAHALVLRKWAMDPLPGVRLTLINPDPTTPYTGMLPGHIAGHYARADLEIDLVKLARAAQVRLILGRANHLNLEDKTVEVAGRVPIRYDIASINVGITTQPQGIPGFASHGVSAKPLGSYAARWAEFMTQSKPAHIAVIGAGVAGVELILAMCHALRGAKRTYTATLLDRGLALSGVSGQASRVLRRELATHRVTLLENTLVRSLDETSLTLGTGVRLKADFVTSCAGAIPPIWLQNSALDLKEGYVRISKYLQTSHHDVFAVGDVAHMDHAPRPKAGVFAVRQAPILYHNLRCALQEQGKLRSFHPQKDFLKLVSLGEKAALAQKGKVVVSAQALWWLKNKIDRDFMRQFQNLPFMKAPKPPKAHAAGLNEVLGHAPLCGGCAAKVGSSNLRNALAQHSPTVRPDVKIPAGDDAGIITMGPQRQVISTDHLRLFWEDPFVMTRIAAQHALGDIWAMGANPQAATLQVTIPRLSSALEERMLVEIFGAASEIFAQAGADIIGGHTSVGAELTIGFTVTGLCETSPITLAGAQPGDHLILTKPIGTGTIMAAEMIGQSSGSIVAEALFQMQQGQGVASRILTNAHAMTDVTGFGLLGHLRNICEMSGCGANVEVLDVPVMDGALDLAGAGVRSSLYLENRAALPDLEETNRTALLYDPQTSGGLLAAVAPHEAGALLQALKDAGYSAACIGTVTSVTGQIDIV